MGIMGTEVAKSAADVILMDDDFCSIVNGIEEGRTLFDNLTKTIAYTLTHLVPELVAVIINIVFMIPAGMSTLMILSIDLVTEVREARTP
jgi:sodium/potassium-transporting ATPase subunit alpha